jgi:ABC-type iron transport system FetAB ATPase subunit
MTVLLATENLGMRFGGGTAVDGVTLSIRERELRCLIGPNGAGKSTFFKCLTGQLKPTSGRIRWRGRHVRKNLEFGAIVKPGGRADIVEAVLRDFPELVRLLDRPGGALSSGEQQLLALARAVRTPQAGATGRADGGHPALDRASHDRAHRDAAPPPWPHGAAGGAESRLRPGPRRPGAANPPRPDLARGPREALDDPYLVEEFVGATP